MSIMLFPIDRKTSAADAGRNAMNTIKNNTPPQVNAFLAIGIPP
jgi:hypothetical protein